MTTMEDTANGHQLVPWHPGQLQAEGRPVSVLPQQLDSPGQSRMAADKPGRPRRHYPWPLMLIAAPAAVAVWSGWVGLGGMCGFGPVRLLPGIADGFTVNTAITLPVGVEAYGAYALYVWLAGRVSAKTRAFARNSAFAALGLGCLGQVVFHLLAAAHWAEAPWGVVVAVACLPVVTLSFAAALVHMTLADARTADKADDPPPVQPSMDKPAGRQPDKTRDKPGRGRVQAQTKLDKAAAVIRDNPGLTNAALADLAGCDPRTISRARNGSKP